MNKKSYFQKARKKNVLSCVTYVYAGAMYSNSFILGVIEKIHWAFGYFLKG